MSRRSTITIPPTTTKSSSRSRRGQFKWTWDVACLLLLILGQIGAQDSANTWNGPTADGGWVHAVGIQQSAEPVAAGVVRTSPPSSLTLGSGTTGSSTRQVASTSPNSSTAVPHHGFLNSGALTDSDLGNTYSQATAPPPGSVANDGSSEQSYGNGNYINTFPTIPSPTLASPSPAPHLAPHVNTPAPFRMFGDTEKHDTSKVTPTTSSSSTASSASSTPTTTPMHPMTFAALTMASLAFFLFACVIGFRFYQHTDGNNRYVSSANQLRLYRHETLVHSTLLVSCLNSDKLHAVGLTTRLKAVWKPVVTHVQTITGMGLLVCTCIAAVQPANGGSTWNTVLGATCLFIGQVLMHLWYGYARYPMTTHQRHQHNNNNLKSLIDEEEPVFSTAPETMLYQFSAGMSLLVHNGQEEADSAASASSARSCLDVVCLPIVAIYHILALLGMATILCLGGIVEGCGGKGRLRRKQRRLLQQQQQQEGASSPATTFTEEEEHYHHRRQERAWELATVVGALGGSLFLAYVFLLVPNPGAKIFAAVAHRIVDQYYEAKLFRKSFLEFATKCVLGIFADVRCVDGWQAPTVYPALEQWVQDLRNATLESKNQHGQKHTDNINRNSSSSNGSTGKDTLGTGLDSLEEEEGEEEDSIHLEDDDQVPCDVETGDLLGMGNSKSATTSRFHQSMNEFRRPNPTLPRFNGHGSATRLDILRERQHRRESLTCRNQILANNEMLRMEILRRAHAELLNTHMTLQYEINQIENENRRIVNSNNMLQASNFMLRNGKSQKSFDPAPDDSTTIFAAEKQTTTCSKQTEASRHGADDLTQAATESNSMDEQDAGLAQQVQSFNPSSVGEPKPESDTDILRAKNKELVAMNQHLVENKEHLRTIQKELLDQNTILQEQHEQLLLEQGGSNGGSSEPQMQPNGSLGHGAAMLTSAVDSEYTSFHTSGSIV